MVERVVKLAENEVNLSSEDLRFNEATLNQFLESVAVKYDNYAEALAQAELERDVIEERYDRIYSEKYVEYKENGCTEKLAEAKTKLELEVQEAKKVALSAKHKVAQVKGHIRSWDKAHEAALNRGYTLRKELDKLHSDIYQSSK